MCKGPGSQDWDAVPLCDKTVSKLLFSQFVKDSVKHVKYMKSVILSELIGTWYGHCKPAREFCCKIPQVKVSSDIFYFNTFVSDRLSLCIPRPAFPHTEIVKRLHALLSFLSIPLPILLQCWFYFTFYSSYIMIPWNTNKITFHWNIVYIVFA